MSAPKPALHTIKAPAPFPHALMVVSTNVANVELKTIQRRIARRHEGASWWAHDPPSRFYPRSRSHCLPLPRHFPLLLLKISPQTFQILISFLRAQHHCVPTLILVATILCFDLLHPPPSPPPL
ncbi:hypothetical protein H2248_001365 [Termitomyces sp. 'cryptogamus']|nr:hypothetical protein H2248_001365 [Termitomyces sp. 'cryptogamus']